MTKEIKDYLHLYLGCECMMTINSYHAVHELRLDSKDKFTLTAKLLDYFIEPTTKAEVKPILRPLSDMSVVETKEYSSITSGGINRVSFGNLEWKIIPFTIDLNLCEGVRYLLSKHFDLFGLIESGLAIDKTTLK